MAETTSTISGRRSDHMLLWPSTQPTSDSAVVASALAAKAVAISRRRDERVTEVW